MSRFFRGGGDTDSSSEESEEELLSSGDDEPAKAPVAKAPLSRFIKKAGAPSESSSSDDDDDDDDDSDDDAAPKPTKPAGSRFLRAGAGAGSDSESSDDKKVVKSARDKRLDAMLAIGKTIDNALKPNVGDWVAASNGESSVHSSRPLLQRQAYSLGAIEFDKLARLVQQQTNVSEPVPPFWIKTLASLDTAIKEKDPKKKLNALNSKALNSLKIKVKKAQKEFEEHITRFNTVRFLSRFSPIKTMLD